MTTFQLSLSENPFPPLPSVLDAIEQVMSQANRYPEFLPQRLPILIGNRVGVPDDRVVVGAGATGVAMQIIQSVLSPGDRMVFGSPTFDGFPIMADIAGVTPVPIALDDSGRQDLPAMAAAIDERTGLVIVVRPHNPTGTLIPADQLAAFLRVVPRHVVVIVDEAYIEFVAEDDVLDAVRMIAMFPNVLVLRTFSKAFGLAGLRIGYAFGSKDLVDRVKRRQLPFGMNAAAVAAVAASYAAESEMCARVQEITHEREALRNALLRLGNRIPDSHANFLYLPGPDSANLLLGADINAKCYPDGSARIAVGDPAAGRAVLKALMQVSAA